MKSFSSLKDSALKTLENKWGQFVAITLVAYVIGSGVGFVPYVGTLLTLAVIPLIRIFHSHSEKLQRR